MISKIINNKGEINFFGLGSILIGFYILVVGIFLFFAPGLVKYVALLLPVMFIMIYLLLEKTEVVLFIYIAMIPIIQHFSFLCLMIGDFVFTPHMILQLIILLTVLTKYLYSFSWQNARNLSRLDKYFLFLGIFSVFSLIFGYYFPINHTKSWLLFYTGIFEHITFYFIILYFLSRNEITANKLILFLVLTSLSSVVIAFLELNQFGFGVMNIFLNRIRIGFGYHNTNLFGVHSAILFPLTIYVLVSKEYKKYLFLTWPCLIIIITLSILSFNRGTFIVLFIEIFFLLFIKENRKLIAGLFIATIGISIYYSNLLLLYAYRFFGGTSANQAEALIDKSVLYRFEAWELGIKLLFLYPFGIGPGGFQYLWEKYGPNPQVFLGTPHHLFLSIGVDYGLLALIMFLLILVVSYYYIGLIIKQAPVENNSLFKYIKISLIGFITFGFMTDGELSHLSGSIWPNNGYTTLLIILLAIISYSYNLLKTEK